MYVRTVHHLYYLGRSTLYIITRPDVLKNISLLYTLYITYHFLGELLRFTAFTALRLNVHVHYGCALIYRLGSSVPLPAL